MKSDKEKQKDKYKDEARECEKKKSLELLSQKLKNCIEQ